MYSGKVSYRMCLIKEQQKLCLKWKVIEVQTKDTMLSLVLKA